MSIKFLSVFLVTTHVTTICVLTKTIQSPNGIILQSKLDSDESLTKSLAEDICWNLEIYQNESSSFTHEKCLKNFNRPHDGNSGTPPALQLQCVFQSVIGFNVEAAKTEGNPLVVLTPMNSTDILLPYDLLMARKEEFASITIMTPGRYKSWTTLLNYDGSHTGWRRGPDITSWNVTGEVPHKKYTISPKIEAMKIKNATNETSKVSATFFWNSFDDEDKCFHLVNHCDGRLIEKSISPSMNNSYVVPDLPLDTRCTLNITGKYGVTTHIYETPSCKNLTKCIELETVRNLTIVASEGASGWDVEVVWIPPSRPALWYNVTLFAQQLVQSQEVSGNATSATFRNIENSGAYDVAVGAVKDTITAYTSVRAVFPDVESASALGTVLGGSWSALLGLAAVLATLLMLWRRRAAKLRNLYFSEPDDKLPKEGWTGVECDSGGTSGTTEDSWEVREGRLLLHEVVGEGAFGVVRRATLAPHGTQVAVKMLKDFPTVEEIRSFRSEMELMKSVGAHPHIVSLVGCCSGRRPLIVVEYCARGDLLTYLRCSWDVMVSKRNAKYYNNNTESSGYRNDLFKCKPEAEHSKLVVNKMYDLQGICDTELTTRDLLSFCRQIAMGMEFLASNRLVHRDLAARNVLVSADRTLKIADFGLSRDVYEENQYKQKGNGKMPMKWMALESLTQRIYTTQSDVWSFGVVMWEVGSVGASPYAGVAGARLPRLLRAGYRMPRPAHCPPHLYDLMLWCWRAHPRSRPTFSELHARLDELLNRACADDYLRLELEPPEVAPPRPAHNYVRLLIKNKLGWPRGETYERPLRTVQSNHYSSPPASLVRPVS